MLHYIVNPNELIIMAGEGVISHAINSLKMNRRATVNFLDSENEVLYNYSEEPLVVKKASIEELKAIETRIEQLKQAESTRKAIVIKTGLVLAFFAVLVGLLS